MTDNRTTILFAGGGTGGHLFPAIAIAERLRALQPDVDIHFACSKRRIDRKILDEAGWPATPLSVIGMPASVWGWPGFLAGYAAARLEAMNLLRRLRVSAVASMGGFVSGPVVVTARLRRVPVLLLNLDAVPGKANRLLARRCRDVFSVYPTEGLGAYQAIGMPLRSAAIGPRDRAAARAELGFVPEKPLLLITGASQGAQSVNQAMISLTRREAFTERLRNWQILHLTGSGNTADVEQAYLSRHLDATILPFTDKMGLAWSAADLAISRAGAGSVAEIVANRTPTIFLPYPYHKDQHQQRNAGPLADAGGAIVLEDRINPALNAEQLLEALLPLCDQPERLDAMRQALAKLDRGNSADQLAERLVMLTRRPR